MIDQIEHNVLKATDFVDMAKDETDSAAKRKKSNMKVRNLLYLKNKLSFFLYR
jgi:hypothetical protein